MQMGLRLQMLCSLAAEVSAKAAKTRGNENAPRQGVVRLKGSPPMLLYFAEVSAEPAPTFLQRPAQERGNSSRQQVPANNHQSREGTLRQRSCAGAGAGARREARQHRRTPSGQCTESSTFTKERVPEEARATGC